MFVLFLVVFGFRLGCFLGAFYVFCLIYWVFVSVFYLLRRVCIRN